MAKWLSRYGYQENDLIVSDLPNISENLLLQLACNRLGVGYGTAKNLEGMTQFPKVKGAVSATSQGFLAETNLPLPYLGGDFLMELIESGLDGETDDFDDSVFAEEKASRPHGFYNSTKPYTNQQALDHGKDSINKLQITEQDVVCVSITLCHAFGIGSSVCAALQSGAAIALPAVGGIQGCGVPSERAAATLSCLESEECTLLMADTHTLKALPEPSSTLKLRGGVCKIGSGATFLEETREYAGVTLNTIGKAS